MHETGKVLGIASAEADGEEFLVGQAAPIAV
jgi:hypothetical protein